MIFWFFKHNHLRNHLQLKICQLLENHPNTLSFILTTYKFTITIVDMGDCQKNQKYAILWTVSVYKCHLVEVTRIIYYPGKKELNWIILDFI